MKKMASVEEEDDKDELYQDLSTLKNQLESIAS